ncbi:hypothetical protein J4205_03115 [Candidatus Pacearchaeota archaeon]|nr:hypothetical protein [Candidatus Pacearchaeota archaeon]
MIVKINPDLEKAKSIFGLVKSRISIIDSLKKVEFPTVVAENYYEIIKELISISLLVDGLKAVGENAHRDLIERFGKYTVLNNQEIAIIQDLRIKRNKSLYEGKQIGRVYLDNNENSLIKIMVKLEKYVKDRLGEK